MNTLTRRGMRLALMTVGFTGLFVAVNAVPGSATPPSDSPGHKFQSALLGHGTYVSHGSLRLEKGLEIVVAQNTIDPGGYSGWHSHPGGAIVVVQVGELTTYKSAGKGDEQGQSQSDQERGGPFRHCIITRYTQGQSFSEAPGEALNAVNTGSIVATTFAIFPGVPVDKVTGKTLQRTDEPNPGTCPV
jgi:hypothetical protein